MRRQRERVAGRGGGEREEAHVYLNNETMLVLESGARACSIGDGELYNGTYASTKVDSTRANLTFLCNLSTKIDATTAPHHIMPPIKPAR